MACQPGQALLACSCLGGCCGWAMAQGRWVCPCHPPQPVSSTDISKSWFKGSQRKKGSKHGAVPMARVFHLHGVEGVAHAKTEGQPA